ncbi:hypothetical protein L218DRAFT_1012136 [Marasmius fiardii PR-910]|nr:hypothetical protein L218DRAFT_1012136 [Marasmius fiardii PR-910]
MVSGTYYVCQGPLTFVKLSDAQRPACSTCIRSYNHTVAHSPPGTQHPPAPESLDTSTDTDSLPVVATDGPKSKYEELENRIRELEGKLRQKEKATAVLVEQAAGGSSSSSTGTASLRAHSPNDATGSPSDSIIDPPTSLSILDAPLANSSSSNTIFFPNWPLSLPEPKLLHYLVSMFFLHHPHASRLIHRPTFMASLVLSPDHPKFPIVSILHAICAVASSYTGIVSSPPPADYSKIPTHAMFTQSYRATEGSEVSFSEQQAQLAKKKAQQLESLGVNLIQVVQTNVILAWYYCSHSRSVLLFLTSAHALRLLVPLGLNVCPPFLSLSKSSRSEPVVPAARTVIEDETRRNTFWLAYAIEQCHGCSSGWANSLNDQDVFQLLPVTDEQFQRADLVPPSIRQWSHSRDLLLSHTGGQSDPFTLYIKSIILASKVKSFNLRFRARHFAGDESFVSVNGIGTSEPVDVRKSLSFTELDRVVSNFISTFPQHLQTPIKHGVVDCTLVPALAVPHLAMIILHEPHADIAQNNCVSAQKILAAARAIVDLIYELWSTSFDLSLLESFTSVCFFHSGRVLASFLHVALSDDYLAQTGQVSTLQSQISVCRTACDQMGQRHALGVRFTTMLDEIQREALYVAPTATAGW